MSRALISLLEIYQQHDGSIVLPEVLVPYVGRERLTSS
jgi:seryl-tRNA synthetase